jgi:hypothetical protein
VAGIGGVIALTVAYRKQRLNEAEVEGERAKLWNERFAAAADQLASERAANRLAGVYAMAALADEWDSGRQTCVNVLCAYMRMPYEVPPRREQREAIGLEEFRPILEERLVRKTVLSVIAERLRAAPVPGRTWHECDFEFTGATIDEGNFSRTLFLGTVSFEYTRFPRGSIDFRGAVFRGPVSFRRSHCSGGRVLFDAAEFHSEVDFSALTVSEGFLNFNRTSFHHRRLSFASSVFSGGKVRFDSCKFATGSRMVFNKSAFTGSDVACYSLNPQAVSLSFGAVTAFRPPPAFDKASETLWPGRKRDELEGNPASAQ